MSGVIDRAAAAAGSPAAAIAGARRSGTRSGARGRRRVGDGSRAAEAPSRRSPQARRRERRRATPWTSKVRRRLVAAPVMRRQRQPVELGEPRSRIALLEERLAVERQPAVSVAVWRLAGSSPKASSTSSPARRRNQNSVTPRVRQPGRTSGRATRGARRYEPVEPLDLGGDGRPGVTGGAARGSASAATRGSGRRMSTGHGSRKGAQANQQEQRQASKSRNARSEELLAAPRPARQRRRQAAARAAGRR